MSNVIKIKRGSAIPKESQLSEYELGYCTGDGLLYIGSSSTNPSTNAQCIKYLPLAGGTITGQLILNKSDGGSDPTTSSLYAPNGFVACKWLCTTTNASDQARPQNSGIAVIDNSGWIYRVNQNTISINSFKDTLSVSKGGTGATTFSAGQVLIGQGTSSVTTRAVHAPTTTGPLLWTDGSTVNANKIATVNSLAYWNGQQTYVGAGNQVMTSSYLEYCDRGRFGTACTYGVSTSVTSGDTNLITSGAVHTKCANYLPLSGGTLRPTNSSGMIYPLTVQNGYSCESLSGGPGVGIKFLLASDDNNKYSAIEGIPNSTYANTTGLRTWVRGQYKNTTRNDYWFYSNFVDAVFKPFALGVQLNWGAGTASPESNWSNTYTPTTGQIYFRIVS